MNREPAEADISRRLELVFLAALVFIFICFTWRTLTMYFSDDDAMNMYLAWMTPALKLWKAQFLPWMAVSRPLGNAVYRIFYGAFGFHPLPLYTFCWLLLTGNVIVAWRLFRAVSQSAFVAVLALSLTLVHGLFQDLYLSAGTVYDQLCFLFTALAVTVYADTRRDAGPIKPGPLTLICFLCLMAVNSKESGAAVPAILFCYECVRVVPGAWRKDGVRRWIRSIAPLYTVLAAMGAAFVIGRVRGTESLAGNPAYRPHLNVSVWMANVARYISLLGYHSIRFSSATAAALLLAMLAIAAALRNRVMLFGWFWFTIAITPVALIAPRPGYVLYVPFAGLGLYFAALIGLPLVPVRARLLIVVIVTAVTILIHRAHWPQPWRVSESTEWRLADKMTRDYPSLRPGARILFADDYPADNSYDAMFTLRLLYHDPLLEVAKLDGAPEQRPDRPFSAYFPVLTTGLGTYLELDRRNVEESVRLNILQDYLPGKDFDYDRLDHVGYLVSGVIDSGQRGVGAWTTGSAKLKFDLYPADWRLTLRFWLPEYITGSERRLSVRVGGETVGTIALNRSGENTAQFSAPAHAISTSGYTILALDVDRPYVKDGQQYGIVLLRADFEYAGAR
jgi:hypothetical protein